jgi:hypothetical protein
VELRSTPHRAFDGKNPNFTEATLSQFRSEFLWPMEIGRSEVKRIVRGIAVLTGIEIARNNFTKCNITKETRSRVRLRVRQSGRSQRPEGCLRA